MTDPTPKKAKDLILQIKTLKTYQSVQFQKDLHNYFTAERQDMKGITIEFNITQQLIHIRTAKDYKVVVPANVQYLEPA